MPRAYRPLCLPEIPTAHHAGETQLCRALVASSRASPPVRNGWRSRRMSPLAPPHGRKLPSLSPRAPPPTADANGRAGGEAPGADTRRRPAAESMPGETVALGSALAAPSRAADICSPHGIDKPKGRGSWCGQKSTERWTYRLPRLEQLPRWRAPDVALQSGYCSRWRQRIPR